jgi:hypothetical protein
MACIAASLTSPNCVPFLTAKQVGVGQLPIDTEIFWCDYPPLLSRLNGTCHLEIAK